MKKTFIALLLLFSTFAYATHYNQIPYPISAPTFTMPVTAISAPTPVRIALRRPSTFYSAPAVQQSAFPAIERDVYEGYSQPPFPEQPGGVGTRWENGVLSRDEYEGFRQPSFMQDVAWPIAREEYEGYRQPPFFQAFEFSFPQPTASPAFATPAPAAFVPAPVPAAFPPSVREISLRITHSGGFSPSVISVNKGDAVRIRASTDFTSHMHGIVIGSPYDVDRRVTSTSAFSPDVIEFIANKAGSFAISCGCGSEHFALGGVEFRGTLVVN